MNIKLRFLENKDADGMLEWMKDPSITCFFRFDPSNITRESCEEFIRSAKSIPKNLHYAIVDENDNYLGTISLKEIDMINKRAEYAICTRKCSHGTGNAWKATKQILEIAFEQIKLESIYLNVLAINERANAFYKKVGFRFKYCEEHAIEIRGEWKDLNWYDISAEKYFGEIKNA